MRYEPDAPEVQEALQVIRHLCSYSALPHMKGYLQNVDVLEAETHGTLNQIDKDVSAMTDHERDILAAALDSESINGLDDILLFEQHLDAYTFLPNVNSDTELGRFLVNSGYIHVTAEVEPYLDYARLGVSYYDAHGGAYGPHGYALRTKEVAPAFKALVSNQEITDFACVVLPMSNSYAEKLQAQLGVSRTCDIRVCMLKELKDGYSELLDIVELDHVTLRDMNELTQRVNDMMKRDGEYLKFLSALEAEQISSFSGALAVAKDLDDYTRVTGDLEEYGRSVLERMGTPKNAIDSIEGYMDLEDFGRVMMAEDDVRQTQHGLIRKDWGDSFPRPKQVMEMGGMT